ncbi:unnamed protein product, partial [Brenthis ino]
MLKVSYSQAALSHLSVAITTNPRTDLKEVDATNIKDQLQKAIFTVAGNHSAIPSQLPFAPEFLKKHRCHPA